MANIKYYGDLRAIVGKTEESIEAASLSELLSRNWKAIRQASKKSGEVIRC